MVKKIDPSDWNVWKYETLSLHFFWTLKPTKYTKKYPNFNTKARYKSCLLLNLFFIKYILFKICLNSNFVMQYKIIINFGNFGNN